MKTYQDSLNQQPMEFVRAAINDYKNSELYKWAKEGEAYVTQQNTTIMEYKKILYTLTGKAVPDNYSANHKCATNFFNRFCTQLNQYLLRNGVTFEEGKTKERLGGDEFDTKLKELGKKALSSVVSYGFWNYDHLEVINSIEFVPLWDEETGGLRAGIKYWQIDKEKPLRATYYEEDGFTEYIWEKGEGRILKDKQPYRLIVRQSAYGYEIIDGKNYPSFPIVPLWANPNHVSELMGLREEIDAYDLIKSGFANDLDDVSQIYWILRNAGGMTDLDMVKFIERLKTTRAVNLDDGIEADEHRADVPYNARAVYLNMLENDMYKDAMIVNMEAVAQGNTVATAIIAAYGPQDDKADEFQDEVKKFIKGILDLIGIKDTPTFNRSRIINQQELTQQVLSAAQYLDTETVLRKLPFITADEIDDILERVQGEEMERFNGQGEEIDGQEIGQVGEKNQEPVSEGEPEPV